MYKGLETVDAWSKNIKRNSLKSTKQKYFRAVLGETLSATLTIQKISKTNHQSVQPMLNAT